jgi:hypothetical protein
MELPNSPVQALREFLQSLPQTGSINAEVWKQLLPHLEKAWDGLNGKGQEKTLATKLYRAENVVWTPPLVTFTLERHGGTVNGSSRGELHHWQVNIETGVAEIGKIGRRQLSPLAKRLDVAGLARETKKRIVTGEKHDTLNWIDETYVVILIANIIPETNAQTTASRRMRFRDALDREMAGAGWQRADKGNRRGYKRVVSAVRSWLPS